MRCCQLETPRRTLPTCRRRSNGAKDGDNRILRRAGTFNFGDWKTNPIPGGFVMISKGVTVIGNDRIGWQHRRPASRAAAIA